ncbi:MAG: squalene/phytoene synthase family protein [Sphingosinicella sp.]|nr:squalene/phytoene synthase family protein [Sphingosinicella sp.]
MQEGAPSLDPDRILALSYVSSSRRSAVTALWQMDAALGAVLTGGREPAISQIKLAWWREALEALDRGPAPSQPILQALERKVLPLGISGAEMAAIEEGWAILLTQTALEASELQSYASARGAALFALTARMLGVEAAPAHLQAGEGWALSDLARHSGEPDAEAARECAKDKFTESAWPRALRPLGMLAILAERDVLRGSDIEIQGAPARIFRMFRHRLTGR